MTRAMLWIEEYRTCGCSIGPLPKAELVGYCARHGNDYKHRYAVPLPRPVPGPSPSGTSKSTEVEKPPIAGE